MNILTSSIFNRLVLTLIIAVVVPASLIGIAITNIALETNEQTISAYVAENGSLRERNILGSLERARLNQFNFVSEFLNDPILYSLFARGQQEQSTYAIGNFLLTHLLATSEVPFDGAWILQLDGSVLTSAFTDTGEVTPTPATTPTDETYQLGLQLIRQATDTQAMVVSQAEDDVIIEIVSPLTINGTDVALLVTRLDTLDLFLPALEPTGTDISTYSYLILPPEEGISTEQSIIVPGAVREAGLVTTNSLQAQGPQLALSGNPQSVLTYTVTDSQGNPREVIGYFATIQVQGLSFYVITELDRATINDALFIQLGTISSTMVLVSGLVVLILAFFLSRVLVNPINRLSQAAQDIRRRDYSTPLIGMSRQDEIGQLVSNFSRTREDIRQYDHDMQERLQALTRDLRITQEISQSITHQRDVQTLMNQIVNLIVARFDQIYHAQIFLVDDAQEYAILRASTGEAGNQLLARGHRLAVGSISVIGQVTDEGTVVVARDTAMSQIHRRNEFLQDTRAELAIPLQIGERIIGALDVQSRQSDSFDEDMINALKMLADQLTIAIENANLYTQSQRLLRDTEQTWQETSYHRWAEYLRRQRRDVISSQMGHQTDYNFDELIQLASRDGRVAVGSPTERGTVPFVIPIKLREQILGFAEYEVRQEDFQPDTVLLAEELVNRLALGIDNARLFNESQQTAERERIVNEISARITGKTDIEDILQTAVQEVSRVLHTPNVGVRLQRTNQTGNGANNGTPSRRRTSDKPSPKKSPST